MTRARILLVHYWMLALLIARPYEARLLYGIAEFRYYFLIMGSSIG